MSSSFKAHRLAAIVVLVAAALWVGTGEFSSVGSEEAHAAQPEREPEPSPQPQPAEVLQTVGVTTPPVIQHAREIRVSASTEADKSAVLAARTNGVILKLPVQKGDTVARDGVVMELEGPDILADVANGESALEQASRELEIQEQLFARGSAPELQVIRARALESAAKARLSQAKAAADRLYLRAPFDGVVDTVDVEIGEWVQAGAPVATVLSLDPIVVRAEVGELDVGEVEAGENATVRLVSGETLEGRVRDVARAADPQTRTYTVEIVVANPEGKIPAGMTAEVSLFSDPVAAMMIPRSIITLSNEGRIGVRVVDADGIAGFRPVQILDDTAEGLIVSGVPEGSRVVVLGQDLVRDGDKVDARTLKPGEVVAGAAP